MDPIADLAVIPVKKTYRKRPADEMEKAVWFLDGGQMLSEVSQVRLQSIESVEEADLLFKNTTSTDVRALWLNFKGDEVAYGLIEGGTQKKYKTFATHPWIVRDVSTGCRMMLNNRQVVMGTKDKVQTVVIQHIPLLAWDLCTHKFFPEAFRQASTALLLCHSCCQNRPDNVNLLQADHTPQPGGARRLLNWWPLWSQSNKQQVNSHAAIQEPTNAHPSIPSAAHQPSGLRHANLGDLPKDLVLHILKLAAPDVPQDLALPEAAHPDIQPALLPGPPPALPPEPLPALLPEMVPAVVAQLGAEGAPIEE